MTEISTCPRCLGERWVCEAHPDRVWPHDDCHGAGEPCPICNTVEPPRMPPGYVSIVSVDQEPK